MILEYQNRLGGRALHQNFGAQKDGSPYVLEMGANWIQGLGHPGGPGKLLLHQVSFGSQS